MLIDSPELWIGEEVDGYRLTKILGHGKIGVVFLAEHKTIPKMLRACKIIKDGQLRNGWEREIEKVAQLRGIPEIVDIIDWKSAKNKANQPFNYIFYTYVDSTNLRDYLKANPNPPFTEIQVLGEALLRAKHACDDVNVVHGDLHEGNILISKPDTRFPENKRRIVVTDFGYGGSHNALEPKDDTLQISSIMCRLLKNTKTDELEATERAIREKLIEFFGKELTDSYRRNFREPNPDAPGGSKKQPNLWEIFVQRVAEAKVEAANAGKGLTETNADDYLNAEALGHRQDEWQNLFVPEIFGASAFTNRNVTVITGARGCGKTMVFRRLTLFLDELIGSPSGVRGADGILGFYLNCRDIVEAFPYIQTRFSEKIRRQIIHFFHLCWLQEILRGFGQHEIHETMNYEWLHEWMGQNFPDRFSKPTLAGVDTLIFTSKFISDEKEVCRITPLGKAARWPLDRIDLLDNFYAAASMGVPWIQGKPFFFFLDDYTIPLLSEQLQSTLNPVIFKRRANLFFKISTEASNSFLRLVGQKPLEVSHDFDLLDFATETLHIDEEEKHRLLDSIFRRRIKRIEELKDANYGLEEVLGKSDWSFNDQARKLRDARGATSIPIYYGDKAFVGMWSSDIRSMIQLFNELLQPFRLKESTTFPIAYSLQQKRFYESGGEFLNLTETVRCAGFWDGEAKAGKGSKNFGHRLIEIAKAFIAVCRWELTEQPLMSNQGTQAPKQAFRIEIVDDLQLAENVHSYYHGLLRWHVFLPDWRGRSVRGVMTPRIFLNRRLIPFARLSFSGKDSISLTNLEFNSLLLEPRNFARYWKAKKRKTKDSDGQSDLNLGGGT